LRHCLSWGRGAKDVCLGTRWTLGGRVGMIYTTPGTDWLRSRVFHVLGWRNRNFRQRFVEHVFRLLINRWLRLHIPRESRSTNHYRRSLFVPGWPRARSRVMSNLLRERVQPFYDTVRSGMTRGGVYKSSCRLRSILLLVHDHARRSSRCSARRATPSGRP
jgi:hypothetical protein